MHYCNALIVKGESKPSSNYWKLEQKPFFWTKMIALPKRERFSHFKMVKHFTIGPNLAEKLYFKNELFHWKIT